MKNNLPTPNRETCFSKDDETNSILAKWYQSKSDGIEFSELVSRRISNGDQSTETAELDGSNVEPTIGSIRSPRRNYVSQISAVAATLLIGLTTYGAVVALKQPAYPVADNVSPATADNESEKFSLRVQQSSAAGGMSPDVVEPATTISHAKSAIAQNQPINIADSPTDSKPSRSLSLREAFLMLAEEADLPRSSRKRDSAKQVPTYPPKRHLHFTLDIDQSGFGKFAVNGNTCGSELLPRQLATLLETIEPEIVDRIATMEPRVGDISGTISVRDNNGGGRFEFQSIAAFRNAVKIASAKMSSVRIKGRKDLAIKPVVIASTILETDRLFQGWAKDALASGRPPKPHRDPAMKFARLIGISEFRKFAKTGNFQLPRHDVAYLDSTTIQTKASFSVRKSLVREAKSVSMFQNINEFRNFRESMAAVITPMKLFEAAGNDSISFRQYINAMDALKRRNIVAGTPVEPLAQMLAARPDLNGLPLAMGGECRLSSEDGAALHRVSRHIGPVLNRFDSFSTRNTISPIRTAAMEKLFSQIENDPSRSTDSEQELITSDQMLQIEQPDLRLRLVRILSESNSPTSSKLLSDYVKYDMDPEVRIAATRALSKMPRSWYRNRLVDGLRYPWLMAAKHSAEALIRLNDVESVPQLVELLDQPDPREPYRKNRSYVKRELVSINHLKNCLLCHADSQSLSDSGRAPVPSWDEPLPPKYYQSMSSGLAVRADITYLRQDFSVIQPVDDHGEWPLQQRFDYVVRETRVVGKELRAFRKSTHRSTEYRDVVISALRMLTDQHPQDDSYGTWKAISDTIGNEL